MIGCGLSKGNYRIGFISMLPFPPMCFHKLP